jgi:yecA family protein
MRMSIENTYPNYQSLNQLLRQHAVGLTAAEMHGLISGLLCGGNQDESWQTHVHQLTNEGMAFGYQLAEPLAQLHRLTADTLADDGFEFTLYLPEDDDSIFERVDALAGWVNHFLLGLGMMQPKLASVKGEAGEAIDDLRSIAQLGYDEDEDQEALAQSLEEVAEYVRVASMMCYNEFVISPISAEPPRTLH